MKPQQRFLLRWQKLRPIWPWLGIALLGTSLGACWPILVLAEKADANHPTDIRADKMHFDDVKQVSEFVGNVHMTRGSLQMKAGKVVVLQDASGYQYATLQASAGGVASFRQKRDGGDFWVEGQADRIEYDSRTELLKLHVRARLKRLNGTQVSEEISGEFISYDSRSEFFSVQNSPKSSAKTGGQRTTTVIQPRSQDNK